MIYMKDEKMTSFDFGPFRIHLNSIISNNSKYEHLNLKLKSLSFIENDFVIKHFENPENSVKDKWNLNYTKKMINDYKIIQQYNNIKGHKDVVKKIKTIITEIKESNNLN